MTQNNDPFPELIQIIHVMIPDILNDIMTGAINIDIASLMSILATSVGPVCQTMIYDLCFIPHYYVLFLLVDFSVLVGCKSSENRFI